MPEKRFLYLVIGEFSGQSSRAEVAAAGKLDYAMPAGCSWAATHCNAGAMGKGILCAHGGMKGLEFSTETHQWHSMAPEWPTCYVGVPKDKSARPGPDELRNNSAMLSEGSGLVLNDGNRWQIPVCRFVGGDTSLPRILTHEAGEIKWLVKDEYRTLFTISERIVHTLLMGNGSKYDPYLIAEWISCALSVNYFGMGVDEVCHLGLISSDNLPEIANIIVDAAKLEALLDAYKKKVLGQSPHGPPLKTGT